MLAAPSLPAIFEHDDGFEDYPHAQKDRFTRIPPTDDLKQQHYLAPSPSMASTIPQSSNGQYWAPVQMPPSPSHSPQFGASPESSPPTPSHEPALFPPPSSPSYPPEVSEPDPKSSTFFQQQQQVNLPPRQSQSQSQPNNLFMPAGPPKDGMHRAHGAPSLTSTRPPLPRKPTPLRLSTVGYQDVSASSTGVSRTTLLASGFVWIGLYFVFNMGLTLYNKTILVHFPFPYSLTALHTLCGTIGCLWLKQIGYFIPAQLTPRQNIILALFSVLYTMNIAVSNISLQLVTVPFHQVVRASAPLFTILVAYLLGASRGKGLLGVGGTKLLSLVPVVAGVGFATYGDYSFTAWGFILTLFGTFLAALKTVLTSVLQTPSAASKLATPLPTSTQTSPNSHMHGRKNSSASNGSYEFVMQPVATTPSTTPKSASFHQSFLTAKLNAARASQSNSPASSHGPSWLPSRLAALLPGRGRSGFGFITRRFDLDFGLQSQSVMSTSIKLHPLDLLMRMSPLAFVQCVYYAWASGEMERAFVHRGPGAGGWSRASATALLMNGVIAFLLNVVSLTANQKNGPLTMTVAANVKQVLTILLAMYMFNLSVNGANAIGIALTLAGGAWYGALEYAEKKNRLRTM